MLNGPIPHEDRAWRVVVVLLTVACTVCLVPTAFAQTAANCTNADTCTDGIELSISCTPSEISIQPHACGTPPTQKPSLLQIALRCFEPTETHQAQYTDLHNFAFDGSGAFQETAVTFDQDDLLSGTCGAEYLVAARWKLGTTTVQAQCAPANATFTDCMAPTPRSLADIQERVRLYSLISPQGILNPAPPGPICFTGQTDFSWMELRSAALDHSYQAVLAGRYICSEKIAPTTGALEACNNAISKGPRGFDDEDACLAGRCGVVTGVNLASQSYAFLEINTGDNFDTCCDHETDSESTGNCDSSDPDCSPYDIQCTTAAVFGACDDSTGVCDQPGATFVPFNEVQWLGPIEDIDVGDSGLKPTDPQIANACMRFSFSGLDAAPAERRVQSHVFGHTDPVTSLDDLCTLSAATRPDVDFDGIYDDCDPVIGNQQPADGFSRFILRNQIRNVGLGPNDGDNGYFPTDPTQNVVSMGGQNATVIAATKQELTVEVPSLAALVESEITWKLATEAPPGIYAGQQFTPTWYGYIADGTPASLLVIDSAGQATLDGNASPTNAYMNLNCDPNDDVTAVSAPFDLAVREVVHETTGVTADREVYVLADVTVGSPPQTESRLMPFDVGDNHTLEVLEGYAGIPLLGKARALGIAEDPGTGSGDETWYAYVGWEHVTNFGKLTRVNLDKLNEADPDRVVHGPISFSGTPAQLEARDVSGTMQVFVTSILCEGGGTGMAAMGGPICIECGGGFDPPSRELHVTMLDGSDLSNSYGSYKISDTTPGCSERPPLQNLGLAFSEDGSLVFVANPDQDRVNVIRTDNHAMEALVELPAGCDPHDVDVVGGMAYVVCRGLHSIETIDAVTLQLNTQNAIDLTWQTDSGQIPVAVATRSDGKFLFTANSTHRTLSVASLTSNTTVGQLYTGVNPARVLLLDLPQP